MLGHLYKNFKTSNKLLITICSMLLLPLVSPIYTQQATAELGPNEQVSAFLFYTVMGHCFGGINRVDARSAEAGSMGGSRRSEKVSTGYYFSEKARTYSCDDALNHGLHLWGYSSLVDLLKDAGYTTDGENYNNENGGGEAIRSAIRAKASIKDDPTQYLSDVAYFKFLHDSFANACQVNGKEVKVSEADESLKERARTAKKAFQYTLVDDHGTAYDVISEPTGERASPGSTSSAVPKWERWHGENGRGGEEKHGCLNEEGRAEAAEITAAAEKVAKSSAAKGPAGGKDRLSEEYWSALKDEIVAACKALAPHNRKEQQECEEIEHNAIKTCVEETENSVQGLGLATEEEKDAKRKELFTTCYAAKSSVPKDKIAAAISAIIPSKILAGTSGSLGLGEPNPSEKSGEKAECAIEGIGWFVCPVVTFLTGIADLMYKFISKQFLEISPEMISDKSLGTAWGSFRDIANVTFVIAFLAIVYSQITQTGINNYGIKRLLPRLFIAAVLVNSSLLICQICVDLSNMIGYSVVGLFENISIGDAESTSTPEWIGEGITFGAVGVTALGAGIVLALAFLGPVLLASILALLATVLMLVARKAIVVILIVIAPLAFVAYLLPNTESLYKKWQKMFIAMLILFPTIGVVFGGSSLAAKVLVLAGGNGEGSTLLQITALGISAVPLFVVPSLARQTMQATGSIGGKLAGLSAAANKNALKKANKESAFARYRDARKRDKAAKRAAIFSGQYKKKGHLLANAASKGFGFANSRKHSPEFMKNASRQAAADKKKLEVDKVEAAQAEIEQANIDQNSLRALANGQDAAGIRSDKYTRAAAMNMALDTGDYTTAAESWNNTRNEDQETRAVFANTVARSDNRPAFITSSELSSMRSAKNTKKGEPAQTAATRNLDGTENPGEPVHDFATMAASQIRSGAYSPERIAQASTKELKYAQSVASQDEDAWKAMQSAAKKATDNPNVDQSIGKNRQILEDIVATSWKDAKKKFSPPPPPPPPAAATSSNP